MKQNYSNYIRDIFDQIQVGGLNDCPTATTTISSSDYNFPLPIVYGWVCPKCGRVYAPSISMCCYCNNLDSPWTCSDSDTFLVHYNDLPTYCEDWNESGFSY